MAFLLELCSTILFMLLIISWLFFLFYYISLPTIFLLVESFRQFVVWHSRSTPSFTQLHFLAVILWGAMFLLLIGLGFEIEIRETVEYFLRFDCIDISIVLRSFAMIRLSVFHYLFQYFNLKYSLILQTRWI